MGPPPTIRSLDFLGRQHGDQDDEGQEDPRQEHRDDEVDASESYRSSLIRSVVCHGFAPRDGRRSRGVREDHAGMILKRIMLGGTLVVKHEP